MKLKHRKLRMRVYDMENFFTKVPRKELSEAVAVVLRRIQELAQRRGREATYY